MIVLPEDRAVMELLSPEDARQVLLAIFSSPGDEPDLSPLANMAFTIVRSKSDRLSAVHNDRGRAGGIASAEARRKKNGSAIPPNATNAPERNQTNPNAGDCRPNDSEQSEATVTVTVTDTDTGTNSLNESSASTRHKHGQYGWVLLTDAEYDRLLNEFGAEELKRCITYIDESAQSSGNKNKWRDWNLVIRRCSRDRWGAKPASKAQTSNHFLDMLREAENDQD